MHVKLVGILCVAVTLIALLTSCGLLVTEGDVSVPVKVENASGLGAISFEITYNPRVLKVVGVNKGGLASRADAGWKSTTAGFLLVVVQKADIDGDGTLVTLEFDLLDKAGTTTLKLNIQEALDSDTGAPLYPEGTDGSFTAADMSVVPPVITFP